MAATYTNVYPLTGVQPALGSWHDAKRIAVKLPASVTYPAGTILGEVAGTNEVQTVTLTLATAGTFTLTFAGATTGAIAYDATAATVQAALEALATIGTGNVAVSGSGGGPYTVTFKNGLGRANVIALTASAAGLTGTNEVQTVTLTGTPTGGDFTLTFVGQTTAAIAFDADAATVQTRLRALSSINSPNVTVTGSAGGPWTVTFVGTLAATDVAAMTANPAGLTGGSSPNVVIATPTPGGPGAVGIVTATAGSGTANEVQTLYADGTVSGGTFTISYAGQTTSALDYNATTAAVQTALEALSNLAPGDVVVTGTANSIYILTFGGSLAATDVAAVTVNSSLTGGGTYAVATAVAGQAGSNGTYKAHLASATDGSEVARAILEFAAATDSSGNITLGTASNGGDKQQFATNGSVSAFVTGTFRCEDLNQTAGAGQLTEAAVANLGVLVSGSVTNGLLRLG